MGKNRTIKILGNIIGNIVVHRILIQHTNKPESILHMTKEVGVYGENASEIAEEFNWNDEDKLKVHEESLKKFDHVHKLKPHSKEWGRSLRVLILDHPKNKCQSNHTL